MTTIEYLALFSMPVAGAVIGLIVYLYTGPKARRGTSAQRD